MPGALQRLLLLACSLAWAAGDELLVGPEAQPEPQPVEPAYWGDRIINVCTAETVPVVYCSGRDPSDFDGYEVVLFRRVAAQLGWAENRLNWTCWEDYDAMLGHLAAGDGVCDVSPAAIGVTPLTLQAGYVFTYPTLSAGYSVMVSTTQAGVDYWVFMESFEWSLWVALVLTCVGVGVVLWLLEPWAKPQRRPTRADFKAEDLQEHVWTALGRPMQARDMSGRSLATNLVIMIFAFMMLIMVAIYTANTSANLTASLMQTRITGYQDLPGKRVVTWDDSEYLGDLARRGVIATGLPWDTEEDQLAMFEAVKNGTYDPLVLDSYVLDYGAAATCDLMTVGGIFQEYYGAVAFPSNFDEPGLLKAYNDILISIQKSGDMESMFKQYIQPPQPACKTTGVQQETQRVSFAQVSGLWMLLGASIGIALCIVAASHVMVKGAKKVADTETFRSLRATSVAHLQRISTRRSAASGSGTSGGGAGSWRRRPVNSSASTLPGAGGSGATTTTTEQLEAAWSGGAQQQPQQQQPQTPQAQAAMGPAPRLISCTIELPSLASRGSSGSGDGGGGGDQPQQRRPPDAGPTPAPPGPAPSPCLTEAQLAAPAAVRDVVFAVQHLERLLLLRSPGPATPPC